MRHQPGDNLRSAFAFEDGAPIFKQQGRGRLLESLTILLVDVTVPSHTGYAYMRPFPRKGEPHTQIHRAEQTIKTRAASSLLVRGNLLDTRRPSDFEETR